MPFVLNGCCGSGACDPYEEPEKWVREAAADLAANCDCLLDAEVFRPAVIEFGPYGVHFVDRILGAHVYELHERHNWQVRPLDQPVGRLRPPDLETSETWQLARRVAEAFLGLGVTVPLFGLPTIASALNIGMNLYGQELLIAFHERPDDARRDLRIINDVLCELHRWYLGRIPLEQLQPVLGAWRTQPPGFGQLCGCSCQLLPPGFYADFIAPLDNELLSVYPEGGMIHLCGAHTQHIPIWREMRSVRSLQLNDLAAEHLEAYWNGLREDQVFYVNPCDGMPVEKIVEITGGKRVVIVAEVRPSQIGKGPFAEGDEEMRESER